MKMPDFIMDDVNKRRRTFLPLSKLKCGLQEINSGEILLHLTFSANWNKQLELEAFKVPAVNKITCRK